MDLVGAEGRAPFFLCTVLILAITGPSPLSLGAVRRGADPATPPLRPRRFQYGLARVKRAKGGLDPGPGPGPSLEPVRIPPPPSFSPF